MRGVWAGSDTASGSGLNFVEGCPNCQIQNGVRIKRQCEGIISDTQINPNDNIDMNIVGPLPITPRGYEYILNIQDQLLIILADQGSNLVCELVKNFENLFRINYIKTTVYHPRSKCSLERAHSTLKNLIKISMADNGTDGDQNLKIISMAYTTTINLGAGDNTI